MKAAIIFVALLLSSCGDTVRSVSALRPDKTNPERFVCELAGTRPTVPPEYVIDWSKVTTVAQAKTEHDKFVGTLRTREGIVAGYVLDVEDHLFVCFNNMRWQREFYAGLPEQ